MSKDLVIAIYARVSSDQQAKNNTIGSQIESLKEKVAADGEVLIDEMMFIDEGVSGATLIRPELERLRDRTSLGLIDRLYILTPDRLLSVTTINDVLIYKLFDGLSGWFRAGRGCERLPCHSLLPEMRDGVLKTPTLFP